MNAPTIKRLREDDEYFTRERCHIVEVANDEGDKGLSIARARVEPGVTTAWHWLDGIAERYLIVSGTGLVEVGDEAPAAVGPGDVVRIPPGVRQRITNASATDLVFYALCTPRYREEAYYSSESASESSGDRLDD